jgi:hypothetical protein
MNKQEAIEWLKGNRSTTNYIPTEPYATWEVRIMQADAVMIQQAYYILKAYAEGLITEEVSI